MHNINMCNYVIYIICKLIMMHLKYNFLYNFLSHISGVSQFTPICGPLDVPMVVPFWSDVDTRFFGGSVFYRESTNRDVLSKARTDVGHAFPNLAHVNLGWIFVTTWDNVSFYGASNPSEGCEGKK